MPLQRRPTITSLFRIDGGALVPASPKPLAREEMIEDWVARDLGLVGVRGLVIGRQVLSPHGTRLDLLALDEDGNLVIIELKRDKTPRDIVAQALDYASWICKLTTSEIHEIASSYLRRPLSEAYRERFDRSLPETLNATHQMLIVASQFDEASKRIIEYLSEEHDVGINASFFNVFGHDGAEWLTTDTLLDQEEVTERAAKKARGPWTGFYYTTGGSEEDRPWAHLRDYGFMTASGGKWYADGLARLSVGDRIFYYQVGTGYLGYGIVTSERQPSAEFDIGDGRTLSDVIDRWYIQDHPGDPEKMSYAVGVDWKTTFDRRDARTFPGISANQNTACKLYSRETADFLVREFGVEESP